MRPKRCTTVVSIPGSYSDKDDSLHYLVQTDNRNRRGLPWIIFHEPNSCGVSRWIAIFLLCHGFRYILDCGFAPSELSATTQLNNWIHRDVGYVNSPLPSQFHQLWESSPLPDQFHSIFIQYTTRIVIRYPHFSLEMFVLFWSGTVFLLALMWCGFQRRLS